MNTKSASTRSIGTLALGDLVFTDFNDAPDNPRPGLGYHQLYDPAKMVSLIASLPSDTRVGDTITLFWDGINVQQYELDQATIDKTWLSFSVSPSVIKEPQGEVYYSLKDGSSSDSQDSATRTVAVSREPPGGLDTDLTTAVNEGLAFCIVEPSSISKPDVAVTVTVPAWINQKVGDELTVMWNNIRIDHSKLGTLGQQIVVISQAVLEQGGSSDNLMVNYEIRDLVDNYSLVSRATLVRVEIDPDALPAPRMDEANQSTLLLDLEALGDKDGHVTIPPYAGNGSPYDVTLEWTGKTPTGEISLTLPSQSVANPVFDHATFTIPNAHLKLLAGGSAVMRYTIAQTGVTKKSKSTSITLTGLPVTLAAPVVTEAGGTQIIDLALVIGTTVTVLVAAYAGQNVGDRILLTWKGTTSAGGQPVNYADEHVVQAGEEQKDTIFDVPRENIDGLGGGSLALSYQVVFKATGTTQNSPLATYTVNPALVLGPPTVLEAPAGVLAPMLVLNGAHVQVSYTDMKTTDTIALLWNGKTDAAPWQLGSATGANIFIVPTAEIALVLGQSIEVLFSVQRGNNWSNSPALTLNVLPLMEGDFKMAKVTEATDGTAGVLDLSTFEGDAHVVIEPWPFIGAGQTVWLNMTRENGTEILPILAAHQVTAGEATAGISQPLARAVLEQIEDGSEIHFPVSVNFSGAADQTDSYHFPTLKLRAVYGHVERVENFDGYPAGQLGELFDTSYLIFSGVRMHLSIPNTTNQTMALSIYLEGSKRECNVTLKEKYSKITMRLINSQSFILRCYYDDGKIQEISISSNQAWTDYEFTHLNIERFTFYKSSGDGGLVLDDIRLSK